MLTNEILIQISFISPILILVGEAIKKAGVPKKAIPLINLIIGIFIGVFLFDATPLHKVIAGAIVGLTSSGLYSGTKNTKEILK